MLDKARSLIEIHPFWPFKIIVNGGQQYCVASPKHISIHPNNTRAVVWIDDDRSVYVNASDMMALEPVAISNQPIYPTVFYSSPG